MITTEQEQYLADLAAKGLQEEQEIIERNSAIEREMKLKAERDAFVEQLRQEKEKEIAEALAAWEAKNK
jgi:hypothetical protein